MVSAMLKQASKRGYGYVTPAFVMPFLQSQKSVSMFAGHRAYRNAFLFPVWNAENKGVDKNRRERRT